MAPHQAWARLFRRGAQRHGVITLADVAAAGVPLTTFRRRARRENWLHLAPGVWLLPGTSPTGRSLATAALSTVRSVAAISHSSALGLHGLGNRTLDQAPIHVVVPHSHRQVVPHGVVRHRSRHLDVEDVTRVDEFPVTTPARTIMDIAGNEETWQLEALLLHARQRRLVTVEAVTRELDRRPRLVGAGRLRRAVRALVLDGSDSLFERRARKVLRAAGFQPSHGPRQVPVRDGTLEVDIVIEGHQVLVECDGMAYHSSHRAFERDRRRWNLLRDAGWVLVWVTWHELHETPEEVVANVRRAIGIADRPPI